MSALAQNAINQSSSQSVTAISATARVDYILRFSKQAILVVDDDIALSSSVGSQYLANLSSEQNAAYISMSAKLNDLQVRCRIIEQLFGNILFDPEQSVAVSIINLVKAQKQALTIVIDNAHYLSLQLLHELTQLAEIAKKSDYQINVLMLAQTQAGQIVSQSQGLFHKKLAILSAQSGQLLSAGDKMFKPQSDFFSLTPFKKWLAFFLLLSLLSAAIVYSLYQRDSLGFSQIFNDKTAIANKAETELIKPQPAEFVAESVNENLTVSASGAEIFQALSGEQVAKVSTPAQPVKAMPLDILAALQLTEPEPALTQVQLDSATLKVNPLAEQTEVPEIALEQNNKQVQSAASLGYLGQQQGFVIQIGVFSQQQVLTEFLAEFQTMRFEQYQRVLGQSVVTVLTSEYYQSRQQAEDALQALPNGIQQRSPWIKAISAINSEISEFQLSQSEKNHVTIPNS